ncbi:M4 family metallopeptidase [Streptomyces nondiastaticus]|uniref:M4 family metallopeptidase n=1 Tax=Streptomyces nondiastaticus TaxID=3154512 RepID=UPI003F4DE9C7
MPRMSAALAVPAAVLLLVGLQSGPAGADARPAGEPAVGTGCSYAGRVTLDTTYNPTTGLYELDDPKRGHHRTYDLHGATGGNGTLFTDADNVWCDGGRQEAGVDAHYAASVVWDYYLDTHGRRGIYGDGRGSCSRVHYGNNYANAFWDALTGCMTYGDGTDNRQQIITIETAAHEMTHGVTSATAVLDYSGEAGGLNEATSTIFAAAAEFFAHNPNDPGDYLIGERTGINGTTVRGWMDKPSKDGASKDYWYPGIGNVDVHYSAGPADHFFYLLAEGSGPKVINGVAYDSPTYDGKPVRGIGLSAAEKIWYRALTVHMTPRTNYAAARAATLRAAGELYGEGSGQYAAVAAAWAAVNVK